MQRGTYRNVHQINSKYKDMNKKITAFTGIYNNLINIRCSGQSEADIISLAHQRYRDDNHGTAFTHENAWNILKKCPKWCTVEPMPSFSSRPTKRSKTSSTNNPPTPSSDAHVGVNLNDEDDDIQIEEPQRPVGRNKGKRPSTSTTNTAVPPGDKYHSLVDRISTFDKRIEQNVEYRMKKLEFDREALSLKKDEIEVQKQLILERDFEFYIAPHDHLTGGILKATLARKKAISEKYG